MQFSLQAPAKVNLCLLVGPPRPDGYHELFTVFAPLALYDRLSFSLTLDVAPGGRGALDLECRALTAAGETDPEKNLVIRALRALELVSGFGIGGRVEVEKGIPIGAGLGGGSSDAAAALVAGARLLAEEGGVEVGSDALHALAVSLGADVAFFLGQGPAIGRGIGDVLEPLSLPSLPVVVVLPREPLRTPAVYAAFDRLAPRETPQGFARRAEAAERTWQYLAEMTESARRESAAVRARPEAAAIAAAEWVGAVAALLENDLETASFALLPDLPAAKQALLDAGALGALMSGSGPTLFGVCTSTEEAEAVCGRLEARGYAARAVTAGSPS